MLEILNLKHLTIFICYLKKISRNINDIMITYLKLSNNSHHIQLGNKSRLIIYFFSLHSITFIIFIEQPFFFENCKI